MLTGILDSIFSCISVVLVDSYGLLSLQIRQDSHVKAVFFVLTLKKGTLQKFLAKIFQNWTSI